MRFLVLIVLALFVAFVSALPVPQGGYGSDNLQAALEIFNNMRKERGLGPLSLSPCLNALAETNSRQLASGLSAYWDLAFPPQPLASVDQACQETLNNAFKMEFFMGTDELTLADFFKGREEAEPLLKGNVNHIGLGTNTLGSTNRYWTVLFSS